MSTFDVYTPTTEHGRDAGEKIWDVPATGAARFSWEYDDGRDRLLSLYQKGKDKQWDAQKRIDWAIEVDPYNPGGFPDEYNPFAGTRVWERMSERERDEFSRHYGTWTFSQFLHGEQGALTVSAKIVESVPDMDSKFYAATQTMDEARHVELYSKFLKEKVELTYPMNRDLAALLEDAMRRPEWDYPYLGMQVMIEGLALAAFGVYRDITENELVKQILAYVMQDEARHVAFGRMALRDYYKGLSDAERADREEFVVEGCRLMRDRFLGYEVFETLDMPVDECVEITNNSPLQQAFRSLLFSRIVPCVKDIGLWGEKVQKGYADLGVLDMAGIDLDALMRGDEEVAEKMDAARARHEEDVRRAEVDDVVAAGVSG
jgi:hypothetical protein